MAIPVTSGDRDATQVTSGDRYSLVLWLSDCQESVEAAATPWLKPLADQGNAYAQFLYGEFCKSGRYGVERNEALAVSYQQQAARWGHALSQHQLGMMHWAGSAVVPQCDERCRELWRSAAKAGLMAAQVSMAMCYANGYLGLRVDLAEARRWYELAARQGDAESAAILRGWDDAVDG